ncbi:FAD-binding oxidoreductase [Nocardia spumae]|uniref:FAD-binding oxidoreductase n=1 Tax=Nocardia spumae TaxID=2887190 RepID=UPI001D1512B2|nr:FAD-binding oxidoreductase [Nocardia spumae]
MGSDVVSELTDIVGAAHVLTESDVTAQYVADWTGRWRGATSAVVRPADTGEVARVIAACNRAGVGVVPQGGNTGLVGGSVPMHDEVVLSLVRLNGIDGVDPIGHTLAAGAGVTVARAQSAAREAGLTFGIDLASRDSATLGGIVATNAGGVRMIKYGDTRAQLLGIEAVMPDGSVLTRWKSFRKDNVGYHLPSLLAGSEGTLGVVTKVLMKLHVPPSQTHCALLGIPTVGAAPRLVDSLRRTGLTIEAAEFMTDAGVTLVGRHRGLRRPLSTDVPYYLLVEVSGPPDSEALLLRTLELAGDLVVDATVERDRAARLWSYREAHTESVNAASSTPPVKLDITTPLAAVEPFVDALTRTVTAEFPDARVILFGHIADGNVHVNLLDVEPQQAQRITGRVFELVAEYDGSISAEHGIGRSKASWIHLARSAVDIEVMKAIRNGIDPALTLNPHILPAR